MDSDDMPESNAPAEDVNKSVKPNGQSRSATEHPTLTIDQALDVAIQQHMAGHLAQADAIYRQILQADPSHSVALNLRGKIAFQEKNYENSIELNTKAISINGEFADAHSDIGNALKSLGRLEEAVKSYITALSFQPEFPEAQNNLGIALKELGRVEEAVKSYNQALTVQPEVPEIHNNLGNALKELSRFDEASASYINALAIKPYFPEAHSNLAEVMEITNRTETLREVVDKFRQDCPEDPRIAIWEAQVLKRDGDYLAARGVLEKISNSNADGRLAQRTFLLGDLCDRLEDSDAAFKYFKEANLLQGEAFRSKSDHKDHFPEEIDSLTEKFTDQWVADWDHLEHDEGRAAPVFLVGFPRSGTTLLDTILLSHPDVLVVEEQPTLACLLDASERLLGSYPDDLANLDQAQRTALRHAYFNELDKHVDQENQSAVVIDKMPFSIVHAGLIHAVFPQARFLFVQRHPCDCVLSCFMQYFILNDAMINFLDLETAARLYDKAMTLWNRYEETLPISVHTVRYENLVESFEESITPVLDFLELDWDDAIKSHADAALKRGRITTPSYSQVTQPLYTRSQRRWERYRDHMQPVLPILLPWAKRLGYDA
jgi:tetratricopeptide (TPR) repeat protein